MSLSFLWHEYEHASTQNKAAELAFPNGKPVDKKEIIWLKVKLTNFCLDQKSEFEWDLYEAFLFAQEHLPRLCSKGSSGATCN